MITTCITVRDHEKFQECKFKQCNPSNIPLFAPRFVISVRSPGSACDLDKKHSHCLAGVRKKKQAIFIKLSSNGHPILNVGFWTLISKNQMHGICSIAKISFRKHVTWIIPVSNIAEILWNPKTKSCPAADIDDSEMRRWPFYPSVRVQKSMTLVLYPCCITKFYINDDK